MYFFFSVMISTNARYTSKCKSLPVKRGFCGDSTSSSEKVSIAAASLLILLPLISNTTHFFAWQSKMINKFWFQQINYINEIHLGEYLILRLKSQNLFVLLCSVLFDPRTQHKQAPEAGGCARGDRGVKGHMGHRGHSGRRGHRADRLIGLIGPAWSHWDQTKNW